MRVVRQRGRHDCGVACVAMLAGVSYGRALEAVAGSRTRGTTTKQLVAALRALGMETDGNRLRVMGTADIVKSRNRMLVKLSLEGTTNWHWLVWDPGGIGRFIDPEPEAPAVGTITSAIGVWRRKK